MTDRLADDREALDAAYKGGVVGYVQRMRDGFADHVGHRPLFGTDRYGDRIYTGCACGTTACNAPVWLAHIDDLIAAYNAKVQDFAAETLRNSELYALVDAARAVHPPRESRHGQVICDGCGLLWPCPTIRALKEG